MTAINATSARKNLYQLIQDVNTNSTPITKKRRKAPAFRYGDIRRIQISE